MSMITCKWFACCGIAGCPVKLAPGKRPNAPQFRKKCCAGGRWKRRSSEQTRQRGDRRHQRRLHGARIVSEYPTTRKLARPINISAFSGTDSHTRAEILPDRLACELGSGILQTLCHGLQDFARKLLVRYGASHTDCTDQRAIGQDCLRSCTAPIRLFRVTNQSREQLNVVPNLPADECASALVAACEISCQSADWATCTW